MLTARQGLILTPGFSVRESVAGRWMNRMGVSPPSLGDRTLRAPSGMMAVLLLAGLLSLETPGAAADQPDELSDAASASGYLDKLADDPLAEDSDELTDDPFAEYDEIEEPNDPLEVPNRIIFAFNQALDFAIFRPAAGIYREVVPRPARDSLRNFLRNLRAPVVLANDLLQGDLDRARTTARRFAINSTAGILGLFDVADGMGYAYHDEDFGQTLGVHGAGEGFYIVLPLFGPSNVRDTTGLVVDHFLDPWTYVADEYGKEEWNVARAALTGLDLRSRNIETLDEIERDAIDFYARIRSLYSQHRENLINNGAVDSVLEPNAMLDESDPWQFEPAEETTGLAPAAPVIETAAGPVRSAQPPEGAETDLRLMAPATSGTAESAGERSDQPLEESGIYRRVTPPAAATQTDSGAQQSSWIPVETAFSRRVVPPAIAAQTAQAERAGIVDQSAEDLGGLW
jgi:phospholipid-binding lipoprotein MlaA